MRRISTVFALLVVAVVAEAQPVADAANATKRPRWDVNITAGAFSASPADPGAGFYDNWYSEGRYSVGVGHYWTEHFKTEIEFATTNEGSTFIQDFARVPGTSNVQWFSIEQFHWIQQTSVRGVWQFFDNAWVHPYLSAGGVFQADRVRAYSPDQYYYPGNPASVPPIRVRPEVNSKPAWDYSGGATLGGGSKFYVTPNSYINAGMQLTWARATTVTLLGGFGIDF